MSNPSSSPSSSPTVVPFVPISSAGDDKIHVGIVVIACMVVLLLLALLFTWKRVFAFVDKVRPQTGDYSVDQLDKDIQVREKHLPIGTIAPTESSLQEDNRPPRTKIKSSSSSSRQVMSLESNENTNDSYLQIEQIAIECQSNQSNQSTTTIAPPLPPLESSASHPTSAIAETKRSMEYPSKEFRRRKSLDNTSNISASLISGDQQASLSSSTMLQTQEDVDIIIEELAEYANAKHERMLISSRSLQNTMTVNTSKEHS